jgi:hypothetical protein
MGPQTYKTPAAKSLYKSILYMTHFALHSVSLIFLQGLRSSRRQNLCFIHMGKVVP